MNTLRFVVFAAALMGAWANLPAADRGVPPSTDARVLSRSFEFRAVSRDPKANGETDFKGPTAVLTTAQRVDFLQAYADFAAAWFGDPRLDTLAVKPEERDARLRAIKPQPLAVVRRQLRLNDGWKQATGPAAANQSAPWRQLPRARLAAGALQLSAGKIDLLDLGRSAGWRCEVSWRARLAAPGTRAVWTFGGAGGEACALAEADGWHAFRLQADFAAQRGYLSRDGQRVADFPLGFKTGRPAPWSVAATGGWSLDDLIFIDYRPNQVAQMPYVAVLLADDDFEARPALRGWTGADYDDSAWTGVELPAVHGGLRSAGEDLYLRRRVELPAAQRAWLEVEAIDPGGEIYVNGNLAATIVNRRPVFLEVTPWIKPGANLLAFKVNHHAVTNPCQHAPSDLAIGWFAGRTTLHLLPTPVGIRALRVHTTELGAAGAAGQEHRLLLDNAGAADFRGTLELQYRPWFPVEGPVVASQRHPVEIAARSTRELVLPLTVPAAARWSPERPALYAVSATLLAPGGAPVDDVVVTTGLRTVAQRAGQFLLNGEVAMLNGAQIMGWRPYPHYENAARFNRCAPAGALLAEMLAIKNMGGNLLRVHAHAAKDTPDGTSDPRIPEMADQLGLALMWCSPGWLREGDERRIDYDAVGSYVRQVYNHPSVVVWELSNHPNTFKQDDGPERTHAFVRRAVQSVLAHDTSRLISPTTFWQHTHYANDLGTLDRKGRALTPVPEYTHPLVTRGTQDAVTGYGAEWSKLRLWPTGLAADCLQNGIRAWFNFEHEESAAQPNWNLSTGWPWHRVRSYESPYEKGSIGRVLTCDEWRASQAWQAFSAYESMRKQIWHGVAGFSWCTIEGGANSGTYEKPLLDPFGHAKLAWHIHRMVFQPILAGSDQVDTVYGPADEIRPGVFNLGPARPVDLKVTIRTLAGAVVDERRFPGLALAAGRSLRRLPAFRPVLPPEKYCTIEYTVTRVE